MRASGTTAERIERMKIAFAARRHKRGPKFAALQADAQPCADPVCAERASDRVDCEHYLECLDRIVREDIREKRIGGECAKSVGCADCWREKKHLP
jgi:hypothetical protein